MVNHNHVFTILMIQVLALLAYACFNWLIFPTGDYTLRLYYNFSLSYLQGQAPYQDYAFEYPPLALLPIVLPHLITFSHFVTQGEYEFLFIVENILLSVVGGWMVASAILRWQPGRNVVPPLIIYSLLVIMTAPITLYRYDLFPALLTLMALISGYAQQAAIAGLLLSFGIGAKLYPVILLPILGLAYLTRRKYRAFLMLAIGTICGILMSVSLAGSGIGDIVSFLSYHQDRGLQLESVASGIILLFHVFGLTEVSTTFNFGAIHIISPLADSVLKWLFPFSTLVLGGLVLFCLIDFKGIRVSKRQISFEDLAIFNLSMLLVFMVLLSSVG